MHTTHSTSWFEATIPLSLPSSDEPDELSHLGHDDIIVKITVVAYY